MILRNEDLPAGWPMWFACVGCGEPIVVPECYVLKPQRCERCGGEWSQMQRELRWHSKSSTHRW